MVFWCCVSWVVGWRVEDWAVGGAVRWGCGLGSELSWTLGVGTGLGVGWKCGMGKQCGLVHRALELWLKGVFGVGGSEIGNTQCVKSLEGRGSEVRVLFSWQWESVGYCPGVASCERSLGGV